MDFTIIKNFIGGKIRSAVGPVNGFSCSEPLVALTFDDGPHPQFTPRLLDILSRHSAKATFFMVGESAQKWPEIVQLVAHHGHSIGNHSWNHHNLCSLSLWDIYRQLARCQSATAPVGCRLFRPPYGAANLSSLAMVRLLGYRVVNWNVGVQDWRDTSAADLSEQLITEIKPGSIILLHDGLYSYTNTKFLDREPTLFAVDAILNQLANRFQFVTLPEMFRRSRPLI